MLRGGTIVGSDRQPDFAPFVIAPELRSTALSQPAEDSQLDVIIELNLDYGGGRTLARDRVLAFLKCVGEQPSRRLRGTRHYVFSRLTGAQLLALVELDQPVGMSQNERPQGTAIFKIWSDRPVNVALDRSVPTIKADACRRTFGAEGADIVWAVIDSGIDGAHAHFHDFQNLWPDGLDVATVPPEGEGACRLQHVNFTDDLKGSPLIDELGHGTHVAGIIAGATPQFDSTSRWSGGHRLVERPETTSSKVYDEALPRPLMGVAPRCKLVSLKVMDSASGGARYESAVLAALDYVARVNDDGRRLRIHGVNLSLSIDFEPQFYAAGQSPVCVAVNRLVDIGVVVVVAAGNSGSGFVTVPGAAAGQARVGLDQSLGDPANAELAITVGSTHAEAPHTYGVSYFSSRGPTTDGRNKPDLVAPGERIVSCASQDWISNPQPGEEVVFADRGFAAAPNLAYYRDMTGTSMAAPHVSGAAALIMSTRREFIGNPREVKSRLMKNATSLGRRAEYQGAGLVDVFRTLQDL